MSRCAMLQYVCGGQRVTFQLLISVPSCLLFSGNPKGAMLTHGNVVADFSGFLKVTEVNKVNFPCSRFWRVHFKLAWQGVQAFDTTIGHPRLQMHWPYSQLAGDDCSERAQGWMCSELCFVAVVLLGFGQRLQAGVSVLTGHLLQPLFNP